jgi:Zn-dependent alcohol dehydrogenase
MTAHEISEFLAPIRHEFADPRSLILPALRFAQEEQGWLPQGAMAAVAEATGIPALRRTTRDEPDYDKLMGERMKLDDINAAFDRLDAGESMRDLVVF